MNPFARMLITFLMILILIGLFGACMQINQLAASPTPTATFFPTESAALTPFPSATPWPTLPPSPYPLP